MNTLYCAWFHIQENILHSVRCQQKLTFHEISAARFGCYMYLTMIRKTLSLLRIVRWQVDLSVFTYYKSYVNLSGFLQIQNVIVFQSSFFYTMFRNTVGTCRPGVIWTGKIMLNI